MDMKILEKHDETIRDMVKNIGIEGTDDYFQDEIRIMVKNISALREKVDALKNALSKVTNSDERVHTEYDVQDQEVLLKNLLTKLKIIDERYICFKEYTKVPN